MIHFFLWCMSLAFCAYIGYMLLMLAFVIIGTVLQWIGLGVAAMFRWVPDCGRKEARQAKLNAEIAKLPNIMRD